MTLFFDALDPEEARRRFLAAVRRGPLDAESVPLAEVWGRVLAEDVTSPLDVPTFDRADYDGYAVRADDLRGADEEHPVALSVVGEPLTPGMRPSAAVGRGEAMAIATGAMLPRGADTVVMVEDTERRGGTVEVRRSVAPGFGVTHAGSDITRGEMVLHAGTRMTSRETGVAAALGMAEVRVVRRPRVAIVSTGDEIVAPGEPLPLGSVYDSNARVLGDAVREAGGEAVPMGIVPDDHEQLDRRVREALQAADMVLLSGGTSKGAGDVSYRVVGAIGDICAHGVALKPGKPVCLAAAGGKPLVVLPGFPTSATFTFHEFVAPLIREWSGLAAHHDRGTVRATLATRFRSVIGRREYALVALVRPRDGGDKSLPVAFPLGKGSGSVTMFGHADGFVAVDGATELLPAGTELEVQLLGRELSLADITIIGSHCMGLDWIISRLSAGGWRVKSLAVGSTGGLDAVRRGRCDVAGIHLLDPSTGHYNLPFLDESLDCIPGYWRRQGLVFRRGDERFESCGVEEITERIRRGEAGRMVNRNRGSGTRVLIDRLLQDARPDGFGYQPRTHHAVAAAVAQGRADWGVTIEPIARSADLGFVELQPEPFDFVVRRADRSAPAVARFEALIRSPQAVRALRAMGFEPRSEDT